MLRASDWYWILDVRWPLHVQFSFDGSFSVPMFCLKQKNEENLSTRILILCKTHDRIPFFLALRSSVRRFQMPFEGLSFEKTLIKFELCTQQTHFFKIRLRSFASVDPSSIFLTINLCRPWPCWITCANLSKSGKFPTHFISKTEKATPKFFCISGTSNSLSDCNRYF